MENVQVYREVDSLRLTDPVWHEGITVKTERAGQPEARGANKVIRFGHFDGPFGTFSLAWAEEGIHALSYWGGDSGKVLSDYQKRWPAAKFIQDESGGQTFAEAIRNIDGEAQDDTPLPLVISGTDFQIQVWQALLRIPMGAVTTYKAIAEAIGSPGALRAVGSAVGSNPVSFLIPCHRVIRSDGKTGNYFWGPELKVTMLDWEHEPVGVM